MYRVQDLNRRLKFSGRSRARVIDNRDPHKRGYIMVEHPIVGQSVWIPYLKTPSFFDVPSIGDLVYVEADAGFGEYLVAWGNVTKGTKSVNNTPEEFKRDIPTNRGIKTPGGHLFELDDGVAELTDNPDDTQFTTEKRGVKITSTAGNKIHIIEDEKAGQQFILLETSNGNFIKMDYKEDQLSINVLKNTQFDTAKDRTDTVGGDFTINVTGNVNVSSSEATVKTSGDATVDAGGSITLKSANNTAAPGGVVTDNPINRDPITGIPLVGVGGTDAV